MNIQAIQKAQLAGKTRLTACTVHISPSKKVTKFMMLAHDRNGEAILPMVFLDQILRNVPRGTTISVA